MGFRRGDLVEVASKEDGFLGSYYEAIVVCQPLKKDFIVQYKTLWKDDLSGPLTEFVTLPELRPVPPEIPVSEFNFNDKVDAFDNDGWWVGKITGKIGTKYFVFFESSEDECGYGVSDLRIHHDWIDGKWQQSKIGFPKVTKSTTAFKKKPQTFEDMGFRRGDLVEIASKEDGFLGSYYEAIVMYQLFEKDYIVQYKTLLKDDLSAPLKELVSLSDIRPAPPQIPVNGFNLHDRVDAFDNDGWWDGIITGKIGTNYLVYFGIYGVECVYDVSDLRIHQDWIGGKWVSY
ncbi:hypothetical protein HAX54_015049 [Datura stramonium]|uniref:Agenet domain-containing protein n=1 Tax=Datura stramonium TaxID=4076 RepID=A0ABS8TP09_DATST|nr:hypothetical protein [Datura stramonium]